jgi:hypothetical protein
VNTVVLQLVACVLLADLLTGIVHWWEDAYGLPTWPVVGRLVIDPNIDHHLEPNAMGAMTGLVSRNYQAALLAAVTVAAAWLVGLACWQLVVVAGLASAGNEVHLGAHRPDRSGALVRLLHDMALVQTPQHHARHHRPPFDSHFCTLTNLVNPLLERAGAWRRLELAIAVGFGVIPKRMSAARRGV